MEKPRGWIDLVYTWKQFDSDILRLENCVRSYNAAFASQPIICIYGIPRGGLVPAVSLSNKLGIDLLCDKEAVEINKQHLKLQLLIVDDICDTGKTLEAFSQNQTVTLFFREGSSIIPSASARVAEKGFWVKFPWE